MTNQGVGKMPIFRDKQDMREFLARFRNYLSPHRYVDSTRRPYAKLGQDVALLAYCLMESHFHLVLHQYTENGIYELMRRATVSYSRYFNLRYDRAGPMYRSPYTAKPIESIDHLQATIAYTHLNEVFEQLDYPYSSHGLYMGDWNCDWVDRGAGLAAFGGVDGYVAQMNRRGPDIVAGKLLDMGLTADHTPFRRLQSAG